MTAGFFSTDYTFRIGQRSFTLTPQAKTLLFAYLAMFVVFVVAALRGAMSAPVPALAIGALVFGMIFYPLMIAYLVYLNNCLVVGDCKTLAWILSGFGVATAVMYVSAMAMMAVAGGRATRVKAR